MSIYAPQNPVAKARRARTGRVLAVASLLCAAAVAGPQAFASDGTGVEGDGGASAVAVDTYTVGSGETLWSIAAARTPAGHDVRDTMSEIQHLNAMPSTALDAGEQIFLPLTD